jgi:hypothetical protein
MRFPHVDEISIENGKRQKENPKENNHKINEV